MKWTVGVLLGLSVAAGVLGGCNLCDNLDCDPGGGGGVGGGGSFQFSRGLVFIRAGEVFAADERDFSSPEPLTSGGSFQHPALSPDGTSVVAATTDGRRLVRIAMGGSTSTVLLADATFQTLRNPVFTPDGQSILFVYNSGAASYIGRVGLSGSGAQLLVGGSSTSYASPSFDRQGNLLVAAGTLNNYTQLALVNPSTGATLRTLPLGNATRVANRAVLSPDGSRVAFDGVTGAGTVRLFVGAASGGTPTQLSIGGGNHTFPTWVGSTTLAFSSDEGGGDAVYRVPATGGSAELIVPSADQPTYGPQ